jgi:hydrogenase maturation protein HypF
MTLHRRVAARPQPVAIEIRVRGRVQGVGFRPTVWRYARELGLVGEVLNDGDGVLVRVGGNQAAVATFVHRLEREPPPLAHIEHVETSAYCGALPDEFCVAESAGGVAHTQVAPDAAICSACAQEIVDPLARRYRHAFANCTHCGPRLSIVHAIPYDRANTTMAPFCICEACNAEYSDPSDRRFHAEAINCRECGPKAMLVRLDGGAADLEQHSMLDDVDVACDLIQNGEIVAIKGLGGYHLACDATNADTVANLRRLKRRDAKPFALMARDIDVIRRYCPIDAEEERQLASPQAPIMLLRAAGPESLPEGVAPGLVTLGFMLPMTPIHVLILRRVDRPLIMTSGNLSDEPQVITNADARARLAGIATYALVHDREIANRIDDSVVRVMDGRPRVLRRARGFAPTPIRLPYGFATSPDLLAMGGQLKTTFCLIKDGEAILSQHQGDLEDAATYDDYCKNLALYRELFDHTPIALVADRHPEYLASKLARDRARIEALSLIETQHHHAHVAACLVDNAYPLAAPAVLGIVLDGLGWGEDGTIWGGEFLLADYRRYERLATFKPVPMLGGAQAVREPWRNLYAHLMAEIGWPAFAMNFSQLEVHGYLAGKPRALLDAMVKSRISAPLASSCGRLFDAVAAALNLCRERQAYEGEAAARLEALVDEDTLRYESDSLGYPLTTPNLRGSGLPYVEPLAMWNAILGDLILRTPAAIMSARFHKGLAKAVVAMTKKLARQHDTSTPRFTTVALSGGCFQNCTLFEEVRRRLKLEGFNVLSHAQVPANDGGLALGQAAIGAAHLIDINNNREGPDYVPRNSRTDRDHR